MKKNIVSYIISMAFLFLVIAYFRTNLTMWVGAVNFATLSVFMPNGIIAILSVICALIFGFMAGDFLGGVLISLTLILTGIAVGKAMRSSKSMATIVATGSVFHAVTSLVYYYYLSLIGNTTIKGLFNLVYSPESLSQMATEMNVDMSVLNQSVELAQSMTPAIVMISALSFSFFTFVFSRFSLERRRIKLEGVMKVSEIKLDRSLTLCFILFIVLTFFVEGTFLMILYNTIYVLSIIYAFAGMCYIYRLIKGKKNRRILPILAVIGVGILTFMAGYLVMGMVGSMVIEKERN